LNVAFDVSLTLIVLEAFVAIFIIAVSPISSGTGVQFQLWDTLSTPADALPISVQLPPVSFE